MADFSHPQNSVLHPLCLPIACADLLQELDHVGIWRRWRCRLGHRLRHIGQLVRLAVRTTMLKPIGEGTSRGAMV
jgi:hypothetical protein